MDCAENPTDGAKNLTNGVKKRVHLLENSCVLCKLYRNPCEMCGPPYECVETPMILVQNVYEN